MPEPINIVQLLVLSEQENVRELAPTLWAVLVEVERFYNQKSTRATFRREFISRFAPPSSVVGSTVRAVSRLLGKDITNAVALLSEQTRRDYPLDRERAIQGKYAKTIDHKKLWQAAREYLQDQQGEARLLIVTDTEITPPEGYRYIIADSDERNGVISVAPTDPKYWRQQDPLRVATIKHRVRTVALAIVAEFLGFKQCDNGQCLLYREIDGVTALDSLTEFGKEHEASDLAGMGFPPPGQEPDVVQSPIKNPPQPWL